MNTLQNLIKFRNLVKLQKKAGLKTVTAFGDFSFWTEGVSQEEFDAFIQRETNYAKGWIQALNEMDSPFKG